jgi:hypothetical protein
MDILDNHSEYRKTKIRNGLNQKDKQPIVSKYIAWSTLEKKLRAAYNECKKSLLKKVFLRKSKLTNRVVTTLDELSLVFEKFVNNLSIKNNIDAWNKLIKQVEDTDYETVILIGIEKFLKPQKQKVA